MFKKSSKSSSTPTDPSRTGYAFASQNAQSSSAALKKKEQETFYQPLPAPPANNPFADSAEPSRSPSPHASNPLLSHQTASAAYNNPMSAPNSRFAPQRGAQMPPRGESQRALLPDRQVSVRRDLFLSHPTRFPPRLPLWNPPLFFSPPSACASGGHAGLSREKRICCQCGTGVAGGCAHLWYIFRGQTHLKSRV
jgi:hypothetical protein